MITPSSLLIKHFLHAIEDNDIPAALTAFDVDAEFINPRSPNITMKGREEILDGLRWCLKRTKHVKYSIRHHYESESGLAASVEVTTTYISANGSKIEFPQIFIIEVGNGKIHRLQTYEPYDPKGEFNLTLMMARLIRKLTQPIYHSGHLH